MATVYKTPGVFVEEIAKFPPSVAQVETAIPAFIGYTEKMDEITKGDLLLKPKRIGSLVEYELFYGEGPSPTITRIDLDDANNFKSADVSNTKFMYDSLRLFFANGGGDCYIMAVGLYGATLDAEDFKKGLEALMKEDEPTILLFPDAANLTADKLKDVQQAALKHCADEMRMDRVTILDLKADDPLGVQFRNNIGINFLSYGMAYTPWLKVSLPKNVKYKDVNKDDVLFRSNSKISLKGLTSDAALHEALDKVDQASADVASIQDKIEAIAPSFILRDKFNELMADFNTNKTVSEVEALFNYLEAIGKMVNTLVSGSEITNAELKTTLEGYVKNTFSPAFAHIVGLDAEAAADIAAYSVQVDAAGTFDAGAWEGVVGAPATNLIAGADDEALLQSTVTQLQAAFEPVNNAVLSLLVGTASKHAEELEKNLVNSFPVYKQILAGVRDSLAAMPPSGAIAGVYAMVDRTRGVWKAPANVSLANVVEPAVTFTKSQLDALNVDVTAGKSINAIRTFFGKGTLVYGARTLAGNDNEWRYIPVRRLFVMVEESVKKATEQFVFEPNDANTWVKVQAMIENFLHFIWRQGALQGAKPEHAFYVAVGLGKTMNPIDILEGRMIVEIGMAAVRPAEFIILKFSHKMAES
ncbi:phage tail protein [Pontibacter qinzhouensis]|uniref:Phage tail protein n=1 Tax=Pontibacter qinzhouensis TaxID=2603253 RepID=A0A5C8IP27_9BACT|nr:phage tail sheath C-terminal domain-containing protein [Pontibacter qinzhouensis]TXK23523.1 phage tail protein [Pontibacter qinzhouensis]